MPEGGKKFEIAKHKEINRNFKTVARKYLNYDQLYLRRLQKEILIELQFKHS